MSPWHPAATANQSQENGGGDFLPSPFIPQKPPAVPVKSPSNRVRGEKKEHEMEDERKLKEKCKREEGKRLSIALHNLPMVNRCASDEESE